MKASAYPAASIQGKFVGRPVLRLADPPLLTGKGCFAADVSFPHQLHMRVLRSARAHGRITSIDTAAALAAPGVVAVWTSRDVAGLPPIGFREGLGMPEATVVRLMPYMLSVLAGERVALCRRAGSGRLCRGFVTRRGRGRPRHGRGRGMTGPVGRRGATGGVRIRPHHRG